MFPTDLINYLPCFVCFYLTFIFPCHLITAGLAFFFLIPSLEYSKTGWKRLPAVWEIVKEKDPQHFAGADIRTDISHLISSRDLVQLKGQSQKTKKQNPTINVSSLQQHLKMKIDICCMETRDGVKFVAESWNFRRNSWHRGIRTLCFS